MPYFDALSLIVRRRTKSKRYILSFIFTQCFEEMRNSDGYDNVENVRKCGLTKRKTISPF